MKKIFQIDEYKEQDDELIEILASDASKDRDNDTIDPNGWDFNGWLKTGSLLYGHDPSKLPVGSAEGAQIKNGQLILTSRLAKKGTSEWHDAIRSLVAQKILKGVSVGFKSNQYEPNEFGGRHFVKQELLEISLTPIPSNANARVLIKDFSDEVQKSLYGYNEMSDEELDIIEKQIKDIKQQRQDELKQEETEVVEPDNSDKFLKVVDSLKSIFGEK